MDFFKDVLGAAIPAAGDYFSATQNNKANKDIAKQNLKTAQANAQASNNRTKMLIIGGGVLLVVVVVIAVLFRRGK